jgi:hypothetical protein
VGPGHQIKKPRCLNPGNPAIFSSPEETRGFPSPPYSEFGVHKDFRISRLLNYCQEKYKPIEIFFVRGYDQKRNPDNSLVGLGYSKEQKRVECRDLL